MNTSQVDRVCNVNFLLRTKQGSDLVENLTRLRRINSLVTLKNLLNLNKTTSLC